MQLADREEDIIIITLYNKATAFSKLLILCSTVVKKNTLDSLQTVFIALHMLPDFTYSLPLASTVSGGSS